MAGRIRIRAEILEEMLRQARREPGVECCGLAAGRDGIISVIFPAENALGSAKAYEIAPLELFRMFRRMREEGLEHLGIYHSHPAGENVPSPSDIEQSCYPDHAYFILSPRPGAPRPARAFSIREGCVEELEIVILSG
ncbi:MAG: M67 family metallopeptidase [Candidatus Acidiferrales bacterium]